MVKKLNGLSRRKMPGILTQIPDAALATPPRNFALGLRWALAAVQAAHDLLWATTPFKGRINRLIILTRTMYGRTEFELLDANVLDAE